MMFSREGWRWVKQKIVSKCQQSFGSFPLKIQTESLFYMLQSPAQEQEGGAFCLYVCIIMIEDNIAIHNLPKKVDANGVY